MSQVPSLFHPRPNLCNRSDRPAPKCIDLFCQNIEHARSMLPTPCHCASRWDIEMFLKSRFLFPSADLPNDSELPHTWLSILSSLFSCLIETLTSIHSEFALSLDHRDIPSSH